MSKCKHKTAKQNQKIPFHFFFRFAVEGWGEETREKCKEIFWFLHTRVRERVRGALSRFTTKSGRTMQFQATTRSARAKINHFVIGNRFELGTINTPKQNSTAFSKPEGGTREARPTDFPPFLQDNLARCLRQRAGFFRKEGGSISEAILIHTICLIQK